MTQIVYSRHSLDTIPAHPFKRSLAMQMIILMAGVAVVINLTQVDYGKGSTAMLGASKSITVDRRAEMESLKNNLCAAANRRSSIARTGSCGGRVCAMAPCHSDKRNPPLVCLFGVMLRVQLAVGPRWMSLNGRPWKCDSFSLCDNNNVASKKSGRRRCREI